MPNIRDFNAPSDLGLRPDDRAAESTANSGRRIAALYSEVGDAKSDIGRRASSAVRDVGEVAVKYAEHREISQGAATAATTLSNLDTAWNNMVKNADPNDPSVAAKFKEQVLEPTLEKLGSGPITEGGQKFAEAAVERFRNHFTTKTSADMATLASVAAKKNIDTLTNQLSNAALTDPTSLKTSLDMVEHSIGSMVDSSPNLRGVEGAKLRMELTQSSQAAIVKAAAIGAISVNPDAGLKQFSGPEYSKYISGTELKQLQQQAQTVERARRVDENYALQTQKLQKQEASDAREGEYLSKLHSDDPAVQSKVSARAIANDFTLTREARERMIGIVERETKPEAAAKVSNGTATDLISRMRAPPGDPRRIDSLDPVYDAYEKGKLSKADLKFVRDEYTNLRTPDGQALGAQQEEFIKSVKPLIDKSNPLLGKIDQSGPQQVYNFTMDLRRKIDQYRREGKDPRDLMDPSKPDYMGGPAALAAYQKPLQQSLQDTARALRGGGSGLPPAESIVGVTVETLPPPAAPERTAGSIYKTPRGDMKWTGTGWVKP